MTKKILNWVIVLIWMGVIFYFSSQPDLKSDLPSSWDLFFRKIAHIAEFAVLTYFLTKAFFAHGMSRTKLLIFSAFVAIAYAFFDEYHQTFTSGRMGSLKDVFIDSLGVLFIVVFYREKRGN